ncbi:MAG: hypothetical protein AMXMBFR53_13400 [Gemmatimonadota bacterium]
MGRSPRFSSDDVAAFRRAKILGVRSGSEHRPTGVWVVVVEGRVFVRSWNDAPGGWCRAFRAEPAGSVQLGDREIAVRAVATRSPRLRAAVTAAYAAKYPTAGSLQWVEGFAEAWRAANTLELVPR